MTDNTDAPDDAEEQVLSLRGREADMYLGVLSDLLELDTSHGSSVSVSLNIPGGVIYGQMISHSAWIEGWESGLRDVAGEGADLVAKMPRMMRERMAERARERGAAGVEDNRWVHLRNATFVTGAVNTTMHYRLWRGRLDDVVGWSLWQPE